MPRSGAVREAAPPSRACASTSRARTATRTGRVRSMLLAIVYHYIVEDEPEHPRAIFPVTAARLAEQLEMVGRGFEFVSRDDVLKAVRRRSSLPERACLVTFDDGLRCQYD